MRRLLATLTICLALSVLPVLFSGCGNTGPAGDAGNLQTTELTPEEMAATLNPESVLTDPGSERP